MLVFRRASKELIGYYISLCSETFNEIAKRGRGLCDFLCTFLLFFTSFIPHFFSMYLLLTRKSEITKSKTKIAIK